MNSVNPFSFCLDTVRELLYSYYCELADMLVDENLEAVFVKHDDWNGGIDTYRLIFKIPVKLFLRIESDKQIESLENKVKVCFDHAMRGDYESLVLEGVVLQPSADIIQTIGEKVDDSMWQRGYFRLFISHCSDFKQSASNLKIGLRHYGIDAFVAHNDIDISRKWTEQLENALYTMDALAAILTNNFKSSNWCDQEVGVALGQRKLVIPIARERNPYGIMGQLQALMIRQKHLDARAVAEKVWGIIVNDKRTSVIYWEKLIDLFISSTCMDEALQKLDIFQKCSDKQVIETLHNSYPAIPLICSKEVLDTANAIFKKWNLTEIPVFDGNNAVPDELDLPF